MAPESDVVVDNLRFLIEQRLSLLRTGKPDAKLALEVSSFYRQQGCGLLLSRLDEKAFSQCALEAARTYLSLLKQRQECSEFDQYYLTRSKADPLFDALAIGAHELARDIALLLPSAWMRRMEPEEDFYYFGILINLLSRSGDVDETVAAFKQSLRGGESYRFEIASALRRLDVDAFEEGLEKGIGERIKRLERERRSGLYNTYLHATEAHVFVEGIALVRLAEHLGMKVRRRYRTVPEISG